MRATAEEEAGPGGVAAAAPGAEGFGWDGKPGVVVARLPVELEVDEAYHVHAEMAGVPRGGAPLKRAGQKVVVRGGEGPLRVALTAERACGSIAIAWAATSLGGGHWADSLPLPDGFAYRVRHKESATVVMAGRYEGRLHADNPSTLVPGEGIIFI
eukprot:7379953-Prymnesium_polylepis.1